MSKTLQQRFLDEGWTIRVDATIRDRWFCVIKKPRTAKEYFAGGNTIEEAVHRALAKFEVARFQEQKS